MMHRINIKDTPRLLEIALQPVVFRRPLAHLWREDMKHQTLVQSCTGSHSVFQFTPG
mgnify:CR=1 FL=1